jgi:Leucine-rich repeat (LRR) protein
MLEYFNLSNNKIESLPKSIGTLKSLEYLFLKDNRLKSLPESICSLDNLKHLDLQENQLKAEESILERLEEEDIKVII